MRWYIASRTSRMDEVRDYLKKIEKNGHEAAFDWTSIDVKKPYRAFPKESSDWASKVINGIRDSDIFVLISDAHGTDMYLELGVALMNNTLRHNMKIYVVGEHNSRSLMHFHPFISRVGSMEDVFSAEEIR